MTQSVCCFFNPSQNKIFSLFPFNTGVIGNITDLITEKKQQKNMFYTLNRDKSLELVEFFEDIYDYNLKSLKEYVEGKEKKTKKTDIR